jgi:hypothetical protein
MPAISAANLAALRDQFQWSKFYLGVLKPATVHTSQINYPSIPRGTLAIPFDGGAYGTGFGAGSVTHGMTLWVGSTAGAHDICKLRIRTPYNRTCTAGSAFSTADGGVTGIITVCEHNYLLKNNYYLTIKEEFRLWPRHTIALQDVEEILYYMDYDIQYCSQNTDANRSPIARLGPPGVAIRDASGNADISFWSDSGAAPGGDAPTTYAWVWRGGTCISGPGAAAAGTATNPNVVRWTVPGFYLAKLTVTTAAGKSSTGYRPVFIYDSIDTNHKPYEAFEIESLNGDFDTGGWRMSVRVKQECAEADFPEESMIILWAEDWYKGSKVSLGGNYTHRENLIFVGFITKETVRKDPFTDDVLFEAHTIDGEMKNTEMLAISMDDSPSATANWFQIQDMTMDKAAYKILRWHSTLLDITDVYFSGDTKRARWIDIAQKSLYEQIDKDCYDSAILGKCLSDRMSIVRCELNPQFIDVGTTRNAIATIMDIQAQDWRNEISWPTPQNPICSLVDMGALGYAGNLADTFMIFSLAHGDTMMERGRSVNIDNLVGESQNQLNRVAGNYLANQNNPYPSVHVPIGLNYRVFDIAPQEWVTMSLSPTDTFRGIEWTSERFIPRGVTFNLENDIGALNVDLDLEMESSGTAGVAGWYPIEPPEEPYTPPDTPVEPPWSPTVDDWAGIWVLGIEGGAADHPGIIRTENLGGAVVSSPTWATWTTGMDTATYPYCRWIDRDPFHPNTRIYALMSNAVATANTDYGFVLYRRVYSGGAWGAWTAILNKAIVESTLGFSVDYAYLGRFAININADGAIYLGVLYWQGGVALHTLKCFKSANYGTTWTAAGTIDTELAVYPTTAPFPIAMRAGMLKGTSGYSAGQVLWESHRANNASQRPQVFTSVDQGTTWVERTDGTWDCGTWIMPDPNDQSICFAQSNNSHLQAGTLYKFTGHGSAYAQLAAFGASVSRSAVCKVGTAATMVSPATTVIKVSYNGGTTVSNITVTGNIAGCGIPLNWNWNKQMALHAAVNGLAVTKAIQISPDGGTTWYDKTGNIAASWPNCYGSINVGFSLSN